MDQKKRRVPWYQVVDGFRLPGIFHPDAYRSAIRYKPRPDDMIIVTYPKCGTTWVQNIVACIYRDGKPFSSALEFLNETPFLELTGAKAAETMKRPGAIKVHLPYHLTPYSPEAKYIFVARNPKDACVSFYHHTKSMPAYRFDDGTFEDYFELWLEGQVDFGDYYDTLLSWYEHRNDPNVLFITYEEIKKNTKENVFRIAEFLGPQHKARLEANPTILEDVIYHSSFNFMKQELNRQMLELMKLPREVIENNPDIPEGLRKTLLTQNIFSEDEDKLLFVRKGIVGDWKNHFSEEQSARLEAKYKDRTKGTDIPKLWEDCM